jgi:PKD repeat protein
MRKVILSGMIMLMSVFAFSQESFSYIEDTVRLCQEEFVILEGELIGGYTHEWTFNGDVTTDPTLMATKSGKYYYHGTGGSTGEIIDSVYVNFINFSLTPQDSTICKGARIRLNALGIGAFDYNWLHSTETESSVYVRPSVTTRYRVEVSDDIHSCIDSTFVTVKEGLNVSLTQMNEVCFGSSEGQMRASVSGGVEPYTYLWNGAPVPWDTIAINLTTGTNFFTAYDSEKCYFDTTYVFEAIPAPDVELLVEPDDQNVFLQNPTARFDFEVKSDDEVANWEWDFGDENTSTEQAPEHTYENMDADFEGGQDTYVIKLWLQNEFGCDTTIAKELGMKEVDIFIPNAILPNSTNSGNNNFALYNLVRDYDEDAVGTKGAPIDYEYFNVDLVVFNRYGRIIYNESNYKGDWNGNGLSDGVYYYTVKMVGKYTTEEYRGAFHVINNVQAAAE